MSATDAVRRALLARPEIAHAAVLRRDGRTVAYIAPAGLITPAEVRRVATATAPDAVICVVRRIPYACLDALANVPVVDVATLPEDVTVRPVEREVPPLHLSDADAPPPTAGTGEASDAGASDVSAYAQGPSLVVGSGDPATVTEAIISAVHRFPQLGVRTIGAHGETYQTYPELFERGRRVLSGLRARGLGAGSCVVLVNRDLAGYVVAVWACLLGGIRFVTVADPGSTQGRSPALDKLIGAWRALDRPLILGAELAAAAELYDEPIIATAGVAELDTGVPAPDLHTPEPADVAMCTLSSGSTGTPKIIQVTHRAIVGNALASRQVDLIRPGEASLNWLPFDHVAPVVMFLLRDVVLGCDSLHAATPWIAESPLRWLDLLEQHRVAHTWTANFGYRLIADALREESGRRWDLSHVRTMLNAGEQCTPPVIREFIARTEKFGIGPQTLVHMWGMAETATAATVKFLAAEHSHRRILKSSLAGVLRQAGPGVAAEDCIEFLAMGAPAPGYEVRITDEEHRTLSEGTIGRFQVRGERVTPGYLGNRAANAESFTPDGWFDTGDQAFLLDGEVTITGRSKELIVINGEKYYCHEVEDLCGALDGVRSGLVAACGVPDPRSGSERLAVFYVPEDPETTAVSGRIRREVGARLRLSAAYVVPLSEAEFPRTTSGKIQRTVLVGRTAAGEFDRYAQNHELSVPACAYRPVWRATPPCALPVDSVRTLVFADDLGLADAWRAGEPGAVVVRAGVAYQQDDREWTIDPAQPAHWRQLHTALAAAGLLPQRLLFAWSYLPDSLLWPEIPQVRTDVARCGAHLLSALQTFGGEPELVTLSRRLRRVDGSERVTYPAALSATLAGVRGAESTGSAARHIDLPGEAPATDAATLRLALADAAGRGTQVAWRDGRPYVQALEPVSEPAPGRDALRRGGRYLIAGGTGGIGAVLLAELAARYDLSLHLIGRRDPDTDPLLRAFLDEFTAAGHDVRYDRVDVRDPDALHRAVHRAELSWQAPLDGILHFADEYATRTLAEERPRDWAEGNVAKIAGTLHLVRLLSGRPDAELVVFSSLLGSLHLAGTAAYGAGNSFADALVEHLGAQGVRARSLAWGLWEGIGLNRDNPYQAAVRRRGALSVDGRTGALLTRLALRNPPGTYHLGWDPAGPAVAALVDTVEDLAAESLVVLGDTEPELSDLFGRRLPVARLAPPDAVRAPADPEQNRLAERIGAVLHVVTGTRADAGQPFYELGIGSIAMLQLHARLEEELDRAIERSALFDHPTIEALAAHLHTADPAAAGV
ncbi:SDR family NAD(P)-dependent oxidoreductase [Actinoplanes sp. TFC3]|uniref:SDR family NAD(P)-dependent oxidoreductase n=1 Tax=Actinoplanes sp. TFC3 TaxID=1710355 RepID=UPI00083371DD|nr:SDR family NAD(P)-dependent oxidoreductase [Actinoplanes sp. TFC3]